MHQCRKAREPCALLWSQSLPVVFLELDKHAFLIRGNEQIVWYAFAAVPLQFAAHPAVMSCVLPASLFKRQFLMFHLASNLYSSTSVSIIMPMTLITVHFALGAALHLDRHIHTPHVIHYPFQRIDCKPCNRSTLCARRWYAAPMSQSRISSETAYRLPCGCARCQCTRPTCTRRTCDVSNPLLSSAARSQPIRALLS